MRMKRLLTGLLSAALLGATPIALSAAPAQAATYSTVVQMKMSYTKIEAGRTFSISGNVATDAGSGLVQVPYDAGSATLQRRLAGSSTWSNLETDSSAGSFYFYPVKAVKNATYRVAFTSAGSSNTGHVFTSSVSPEKNQKVLRKIKVNTKYGSLVVKGKISPAFKKKKFKVEVKRGGWKKFKKVKTTKKGKYAVKLVGSRKGTKYRLVVPGKNGYTKTKSGVITATSYRY